MPNESERMSRMLFDYESTNRQDYQKPEIEVIRTKTFVEKPIKHKPSIISHEKPKTVQGEYSYLRYPSYVETMTRWKNCVAPFNLYIHPDPVHGFDPRVGQQRYEALGDPDREKAQKTRPRLVMTPAASLDDIADPEKRKIVVEDMYISTLNRAQRPTAEKAFPANVLKAPLPDTYASPTPVIVVCDTRVIDLPKRKSPYVSPEWRMESVSWDRKQTRGDADATSEFWMRRPL